MRIVVEAPGLERHPRMAHAIQGLLARGHAVEWRGRGRTESGWGGSADLVIGAGSPVRIARTGWEARAAAMIVGADAGRLGAWGPIDRFAWASLWSLALVEDADARELQASLRHGHVHGLPPERIALWSPAPVPAEPDVTHPDVDVLERAGERAIARARGGPGRPALFVDRDGTLVVEKGYLSDPDGLELLPGVPQALREAQAAGFAIVVISNQAGVGRGLFPLAQAYATMAGLRQRLRTHGVELDAIHFCPHQPDAGCACRKPGTLLLERAAEDQQLSPAGSGMVGDRILDVRAGQAFGGVGILVRTGYGREEESRIAGREGAPPDHLCDSLTEAVRWIIAREETRSATH